uniref:Uncharacterized protein n=1 Tax=Rhipicephalus appendiculatus TaxID=34631 RepID=A0A131YC72_RHIAP
MARVMYISETSEVASTHHRLKCRVSRVCFATSCGKTHCNRDKNARNKCYDNPDVISSPLVSNSLDTFAFCNSRTPDSTIQKCSCSANKGSRAP